MPTVKEAHHKDPGGYLLFAALFCIGFIHWGSTPSDLFIYSKHLYLGLVSAGLTVLFWLKSRRADDFRIRWNATLVAYGILLVYATASTLWTINHYFAVRYLAFFWSLFAIYAVLLQLGGGLDTRKALHAFILSAVLMGGVDIATNLSTLFDSTKRLEHVATLGNPSYIGEYLSLAACACLAYLTRAISLRKKALYLTLCLFLFFCISLTQTRNSLLALAAAGLVMIWVHRKSLSSLLYVAIACGLAVVMLISMPNKGYWERLNQIVESQKAEVDVPLAERTHSTLESRLSIYKHSLQMIHDHFPLGVGIGNFSVVYPHYKLGFGNRLELKRKVYEAHNALLHFTAELGVVGALFLLFLFYRICGVVRTRALIRGPSDLSGPNADSETLPLASILAGFVALSLLGFNTHRPEQAVVFWVFLALLDQGSGRRTLSPGKPIVIAVLVVAVALSLAVAGLNYRIMRGELSLQKGMEKYLKRDFAGSWQFMEEAYKQNPLEEKNIFFYATNHLMLGRSEEAQGIYQQGMRDYPYEMRFSANYGLTLIRQGRLKEAEDMLKDSIQSIPSNYMGYNQLAMVYRKQYRDEAGAKELIAKSMTINPFQQSAE